MIVGGGEAGMDAALHIFEKMKRGKVTVIDREGDDQDRVLNIKVEMKKYLKIYQ